MLLEGLRLRHFRNLNAVHIEPHSRFNILAGANGQGKTNVLEAVFLLSAVKSFRASTTNLSLVEFGAEEALLEAKVERGGYERLVRLEIGPRGKRVFLNENPVRNLTDFFGTLNVVVFGPDDIGILRGSPSERRRFIDRAIFNAHPAFATESSHFEEVLKNRNTLLKGDRIDRALLGVYDEQFIEYGARIIERRLDFIEHFRPVLERTFRSIFHPDFEADVRYEMPWHQSDAVDIRAILGAGLNGTAREELERGFTVVGPHRDDLLATLNGHEVKAFASQGQNRAFILAMKIAEITYLEERYHFAPILLLDDVSSELDRERNHHLFEFLRSRAQGQVFITTTHRDHILLEEDLKVFDVREGQISLRVH